MYVSQRQAHHLDFLRESITDAVSLASGVKSRGWNQQHGTEVRGGPGLSLMHAGVWFLPSVHQCCHLIQVTKSELKISSLKM